LVPGALAALVPPDSDHDREFRIREGEPYMKNIVYGKYRIWYIPYIEREHLVLVPGALAALVPPDPDHDREFRVREGEPYMVNTVYGKYREWKIPYMVNTVHGK
jgi:hypothetical protein